MKNPYEKYLVQSAELSPTKRKFVAALKRLINQGKDHYNISVSELCRVASLSRTTFYENFQTVGDVVDSLQNEFLVAGSSRSAKFYEPCLNHDEMVKFLQDFMWYMLDKKEDYYGFLSGSNGQDQRFVQKWKNIIKYRFFHFYADRQDYDFILEVVSSALVGGLTYYVSNPTKYTKKQFEESILHLYEVITKSF